MNKLYHNSFYAMGTRCHIVLPGAEEDLCEHLFAVIKDEVHRVESSLSRFLSHSEISVINKKAAKEPVAVSEEIYGILETCREYFELTHGSFDVSLRPLLQYWKDKKDNSTSDLRLYEIMDAIGMKHIELGNDDRSVCFANDRVEIDLGGFGKGYALEHIQKKLKDFSVRDAFISFGESSILTMGSHPAGDHWKVGLNDYSKPGRALHTFAINDGAVSTSSNFFVDDSGKLCNHRHVINPFTGYPVEECMTVSVRSDSSVAAEVLSTAFLVTRDETIALIKEQVEPCEVVKVNYVGGDPEITVY